MAVEAICRDITDCHFGLKVADRAQDGAL